MESMYSLSILIHLFAVIGFLLVTLFNIWQLNSSSDIQKYAKKMRVMMPIASTFISMLIFTGAIMMAAKHLSFTWQNIVMIVYSVILIVLEVKRYVTLKHLNIQAEGAFTNYKVMANKILALHVSFSVVISGLMYL